MRIGQLAKLSGIPASTIRFYEQSGLLPPAKRLASGYRDYDDCALERINLIRFCQGLGFSLQELPTLMDKGGEIDHDAVMSRLRQKQSETDAVIRQLQDNQTRMAELIERLTQLWDQGLCMSSEDIAELVSQADVQVPVTLMNKKSKRA